MFDSYYILQHKRNLDRLGRQATGARSSHLGDPDPEKYIINDVKAISSAIADLDAITTNVDAIIGKISNQSGDLQAGLSSILLFQKSFKEPLTELVKSVTAFEEANAALNESFGLSSTAAAEFAQQLRSIPDTGGVFDVGDEKMFAFAKSVDDVVGGLLKAGQHGTAMLKTQKLLVTNWGLTNDQAESYQLFLQGGTKAAATMLLQQQKISQVIANQVEGLDPLQVQISLTKEISALTNDIQVQYSRIPGSLELAVLKSKALGISVEQLNRTGESLLDIHVSIGKEIEYQAFNWPTINRRRW